MPELLEVTDLQTQFPTRAGLVKAVDGVSFTIGEGELLGLVGESGCGKSITALSIMRLISKPGKISGGSIKFKGEELTTAATERLREIRGNDIAMIFQDPMTSLNPVFTVGEQIAEALRLHRKLDRKAAWAAAIEAMKEVSIPSPERRVKDYPHQLSGGMRQRVMIAMALACDPELLIADEPTTALDVTIQAQILELLDELRRTRKLAVLLITHDLGVVAEVADRVCVMYTGKIVEESGVDELFENPKHPYTKGLLRSVPKLTEIGSTKSERLKTIDGTVPSPTNLPNGCHFAPRCSQRLDICNRGEIPLLPLGNDVKVRCVLYDERLKFQIGKERTLTAAQ
ncbi:MAG: ABC transporter ATP-binding protein [Pyrinomonadaceae bacterium]|nr:ABC transporter ATP-binding protein [Acidobacteriota bacterium]MBK7935381.1 ABC transporter ATP-binding protein [Acidobacteriota bacterium]MBP7375383.1 ABC transporter ATP-binding protein [Pyrinomonadaceae bacterium]